MESYVNKIYQRLSNIKIEPCGIYSADSICCEESRSLFLINNNQSFRYNCKGCGDEYRWYPNGYLSDILSYQLKILDVKRPKITNQLCKTTKFQTEFLVPLKENIPYLINRGLDINDWSFYTCSDDILKDYVIIPQIRNDISTGLICRYIGVNDKNCRYINLIEDPMLFDNSIEGEDFNLIFEGSIDALLFNGIAILDSFITDHQISIIMSKNKKNILVPDRDRGGRSMALHAIDLGWSISFPDLPLDCKDPADAINYYDRKTIRQMILNSQQDSKEARKTLLSWRDKEFV